MQYYIEGDFAASVEKARGYAESPPNYNLVGQNCAWIALETLQASTSGALYDRIDKVLWTNPHNLLQGRTPRTIIPNDLHNEGILESIFNPPIKAKAMKKR